SPPFGLADTSTPTTVVGTGTAASCTETALAAAVGTGGVITFDCGGPATISITSTLVLNKSKATTIDGGGKVTLDGGGKVRILSFNGGGYRTTSTIVTLQNLTFQNGHATGTKLTVYPAPCSQGYDTDAGGGAVYVLDGVLRVIDCTFTSNSGQTPGPDVAGGAVYVNGSKGTTIIGSRFADNTCSNGGAVGALNSDLAVYTSTMSGNTATGTCLNNTSSTCTSPSTEIGDGGSGGALYMDGGSDGTTTLCGVVMSSNHANGLGGAIFRVFDNATHDFDIDVSTLDSNVADGPVGTDGDGPGAGAFYFHNANLKINDSTISNNSSPGCGALQADATTVTFSNVTFSGNKATDGIGGAMCLFSNGGTLTNCTFAGNQALGGSSYSNYYGAAIFGGGLTLNNCVLANNTTVNTMGRMQCAGGAPEMGSKDVQWPMNKVAGGGADSPCVTGITFVDPMPGSLQNNGGPTDTVALGAASSVVQIGTGCPATDQTGKARATPCTIGALEK
ncbi:MAG: choice-of-anchor Q domain-containing protein, partial [Polyangiaceae bacterium]